MTKKNNQKKIEIKNKKATLNYELIKKFEAGVVLYGFEVKALRNNNANLLNSHIVIRGSEAFLLNSFVGHYQEKNTPNNYDEKRTRKLLLNKKEILELNKAEQTDGLTIIPISWYNRNNKLKLEIAIAKGKKKYDKRESLKKRDIQREINRSLKTKYT